MGSFSRLFQRMGAVFQRRSLDQSLEAEIASHLEFAIEENLAKGMSPGEARRQAMLRFGGVERAKEEQRVERGLPQIEILAQDLRYSLRTLVRDRGFTVIAVLILGLGIAANIVVFSVVNTILLRPLPFTAPEQLVRVGSVDPKGGMSSATYSADAFDQFQHQNRSFQEVTGYFGFSGSDNFKLTGYGEPVPLSGLPVVENFFHMFGVQPLYGRLFTAEECRKNGPAAVLLSYSFWKRQFSSNRSIVGSAISLNGVPVTVVGVLPETFDFGSVFAPGTKIDAFVPSVLDDIRDDGNTIAIFGRLKPGVTLAEAQSEADVLFPKLYFRLTVANSSGGYTGTLTGLKEFVSGKLRRSLVVLWSAVGLILLIVCVNLSNLLLARAATRSKEFALRKALGAGAGRLVRQTLTESLVLSSGGALLGLVLAWAMITWLAHQGSIALPLLSSLRIDGSVLGWTLGITLLSAVLFGLLPGLRISGTSLMEALNSTGRGGSEARGQDRLRSMLVVSEISLACVLLVGAGLLLRSFLHILDVDMGFRADSAATIKLDFDAIRLDSAGNTSPADRTAFFRDVIGRVQQIPGVEMAGVSDNLPLDRNRSWGIRAKGHEYRKGELQATFVYIVTPGYLRTAGIRLVEGRDFTWSDTATSEKGVIINETVARKLWPGEDPIGRAAQTGSNEKVVIGVVADVRESSAEREPGWQMYLPTSQESPDGAQLVIRSKLPVATLTPSVMAVLRSLNPAQPRVELRPMQELVDRASSPRRFFVLLVAAFAGLGLLLATLGIYGIISYSVTRQTQEIGIRMALGATLGRVQLDVISRTLRLALIGITVGTVASFLTSRLIASLLFGTSASDPLTFAAMIVLLGVVSLLAGYVPARRASRIDPMQALRNT
ncbi:ABC transporter permease [Granulicella arctica]|uniref:ABC transporter permease n=1 Tax=Granulicella arctica TaxID=940613 RepID=UPI0021E0B897|nr:ABC transporter permease [Granulicella arctica]